MYRLFAAAAWLALAVPLAPAETLPFAAGQAAAGCLCRALLSPAPCRTAPLP